MELTLLAHRVDELAGLVDTLLSTAAPTPAPQPADPAPQLRALAARIDALQRDLRNMPGKAADQVRGELQEIAAGHLEAAAEAVAAGEARMASKFDLTVATQAADVARVRAVAQAQAEVAAEFLRAAAWRWAHGSTEVRA